MIFLRMMIIGVLISLSASYGTIAFFYTDTVFTGTELLEQFIIAIILGAVIGLGSIIFMWDAMPFTLQLILHFIYVNICVLTAGWFGYWYDDLGSIGQLLLIEVFIYILVWLILYVISKRDIDKINEKIKRKRENRI